MKFSIQLSADYPDTAYGGDRIVGDYPVGVGFVGNIGVFGDDCLLELTGSWQILFVAVIAEMVDLVEAGGGGPGAFVIA